MTDRALDVIPDGPPPGSDEESLISETRYRKIVKLFPASPEECRRRTQDGEGQRGQPRRDS